MLRACVQQRRAGAALASRRQGVYMTTVRGFASSEEKVSTEYSFDLQHRVQQSIGHAPDQLIGLGFALRSSILKFL